MNNIIQVAIALFVSSCLFYPLTASAQNNNLLETIRAMQTRDGTDKARNYARQLGLLVREENGVPLFPVIIDRNVLPTGRVDSAAKALGGRLDAMSRSYIRILVPFNRLQQLDSVLPGDLVRAPIPVQTAAGLGSNVSESASLTAADGYQAGNLTGAGIHVAVVDLGFNGLQNTINAGELPLDTVNVDYTGTGIEAGTKHGVGVAEHVSDMAPGATIHCLKVGDEADLQNAADYIRSNNIKIANHSVAWAIASYYDDTGPINAIINDSHDTDGVFWTVASGNYGKKHWRGSWSDTDGDNLLNFSATDELLELTGTGATITVFLNWNQYGSGNKTNLNLYLTDRNGMAVAGSTGNQVGGDPAEAFSYTYRANEAPYSLAITRLSGGTGGLDISLFSFTHDFNEYLVASSSTMDPASAHGAFTVGAVNETNWQDSNPAIRAYSSQGPTNDGRQKPEIVAPDGTVSLAYGTNSNGTSFSSPTVAGAAALLLEETPGLSATGLRNVLLSEAIDIGASGFDNVFGAGKLQLPLIDSDTDGLNNVEELQIGTNPLLADTDTDGLDDFEEDRTWGTNPLSSDTDADGLNDYDELFSYATDPLSSNRGDLSRNNSFNTGDYVVLTRLVSGDKPVTPADVTLGDLNNNYSLDTGDLVLMMRVLQGQIPLP